MAIRRPEQTTGMEHSIKHTLSQPTDINSIDFVTVLNHFDDGVIITDCFGKILYYNQAQAAIDGLDQQASIGKHVTDLYQLSGDTSLIMQCIRTRSPVRHKTFFYKTVNGRIAHTIHSVFPLLDNDQLVGTICFVRDYKLLKETAPHSALPSVQPPRSNGTRYSFDDIVGSNSELLRSLNIAREAADSHSPILLIGETGTGKELFAQAIHNYSSRSQRSYVAINCAAIPENLLEGLLFGTVKGAFTGALDRPGLFERANGSTLFLDEVLAMPLSLQAKLLRVLQEKKVSRLGSAKEIELDIKIVSSVGKPPRDAIKEGELRVDLFYRLGVVMVKIPPLRQRSDDIGALIKHFLLRLNATFGTQVQRISPEVMELFQGYSWPGNVRELEHLLEGAMNIVGLSEEIDVRHFSSSFDTLNVTGEMAEGIPPPVAVPAPSTGSSHVPAEAPAGGVTNLPREQSAAERTALLQALQRAAGNVSRAALALGISRQLLTYKMKKHQLSRYDFTSSR